jgi:hypothetical protein
MGDWGSAWRACFAGGLPRSLRRTDIRSLGRPPAKRALRGAAHVCSLTHQGSACREASWRSVMPLMRSRMPASSEFAISSAAGSVRARHSSQVS